MRWWGSKAQSVTARIIDSAAFLRLHFYLALLLHNFLYLFLYCSFRFSLTPDLPPMALHILPVDDASLYLFATVSPPHLARVRSDRPPGRRPRLTSSTTCLRFTPCWASQLIPRARLCLTYLIQLPPLCCTQPAKSGTCRPQGYTV